MSELPRSVQSRLATWFDDGSVVAPSVNYAVFDRSGVLFAHGRGEFQLDGHRRAPGADTVYRIASMSKSFLAAAILVLEEQGLLSLSDRVGIHLPEFADPVDRFGAPLPVTLEMLLSNASGLPEDNGWADDELALSRDDFVAIVAEGLRFAGVPGDGYQYSNIGFWMLGVVVENVTGQPFAEFARDALLTPLGLNDTHYDADAYPSGENAPFLAHGYSTFDEGVTWNERPVVGTGIGGCAASMFSTVGDIARWSAWLSSAFDTPGALTNRDNILSRASRRRMQRAHTATPAPVDRPHGEHIEGAGYGLGLNIEHDRRFGVIAQHSGGLPGWSSNMRWHTESGLGVVVFANANGAKPSAAAAAMLRFVLESLDVPAQQITLWPETLHAAAAIDAALRGSGRMADAATGPGVIFSRNLLSDVPSEVRDARLAASIAEIGGLAGDAETQGLEQRMLWSVSPAHLAWSIRGRSGSLECRVELTPTAPPMVQRLEVVVAVATPSAAASRDENPSVQKHYVPLSPERETAERLL
ncbi:MULTISPECIES: serine hydrolase domain-containing protein [Subtercola]|uniref:serine hydrolase domain-containing protein n=1 Tax=Subtercola TaxID=120212 RepID=UPI001375E9F1|nr:MULTISPECIES: serine hydrolase domain-containing protein [Subtercola]MEA9983766.1 serine hydrolase domain-containing protein [Subtercola sp. RTI3]